MPTMSPRARVLIADDDAPIRSLIEYHVRQAGFETVAVADGGQAIAAASGDLALALVDLRMPVADGMKVLAHFREKHPDVPVVMVSAHAEIREALAAVRAGAFEYVRKPFEIDELLAVITAADRHAASLRDNRRLRESHSAGVSTVLSLAGTSPAVQRLRESIQRVAPLRTNVLITGESGVGKGLVARLLHASSPWSRFPMISVSCPAIPRELVESELFGHEKGAFPSAQDRRIGRIELAEGGMLFLDEVGDLPLSMQPRLLEVLQERRFQRVGGAESIQSNTRVVASTHLNLREKVAAHEFREDLYYRLNVIPIHVPPLRERLEDLPRLCEVILGRIAAERMIPVFQVSDVVLAALRTYSWPGNIRELENVLERAAAYCDGGRIQLRDLPQEILRPTPSPAMAESAPARPAVGGMPLEELERLAILQTLQLCRGNKAATARMLGVTEKTIYNKMSRYGIRRPQEPGSAPVTSPDPADPSVVAA
jgi:DNA-binding NtrC family response regulator